MPTPEQVQALADAMWQLLDDMGTDGQCVCLAAKAQARAALEPFLGESEKVVTPGNDTRERIATKVVTPST